MLRLNFGVDKEAGTVTEIQIQPMLRLNKKQNKGDFSPLNIQIQPMLRLNICSMQHTLPTSIIQIQPMLRLNGHIQPQYFHPLCDSNTTNVKVKLFQLLS